MNKYFVLAFLLSFLLIFNSCSDNDSGPVSPVINGKPALLIVVENNDGLEGGLYETAFDNYSSEVLEIFSDMFGVPVDSMQDMSLNEIIEVYGEEWQMKDIADAGRNDYDTIVAISDEEATADNFLDILRELTNEGYFIDMVFCLHGSSLSIAFSDGSYFVSDITSTIKVEKLNIRCLYQTNCYGSQVLDKWEDAGIRGVNGSEKVNSITMFSPSYFIKEWTSGKTYTEAVLSAFELEVEKIRSYSSILPVLDYILTDENLKDSKQKTGGINRNILWEDFRENPALF